MMSCEMWRASRTTEASVIPINRRFWFMEALRRGSYGIPIRYRFGWVSGRASWHCRLLDAGHLLGPSGAPERVLHGGTVGSRGRLIRGEGAAAGSLRPLAGA